MLSEELTGTREQTGAQPRQPVGLALLLIFLVLLLLFWAASRARYNPIVGCLSSALSNDSPVFSGDFALFIIEGIPFFRRLGEKWPWRFDLNLDLPRPASPAGCRGASVWRGSVGVELHNTKRRGGRGVELGATKRRQRPSLNGP